MIKPPSSLFGRGRDSFWMDFDPGVGGDAVQGRILGLSLLDSRVDTVVDSEGATAYSEWTMVFKNTSVRQQEARAQVMLPPGSVVSRLTLWIDGEEREAAFGGRSQVKQAYQQVVQRRRDPVLVTTAGPDRIMMQCFPVPPNNGTMKIRIGITSPVDLDSRESGLLRLPFFAEYNFNLPETLEHGVWVEAKGKLDAPADVKGWVSEAKADGGFALRGSLGGKDLVIPLAIRTGLDGLPLEGWAVDKRGGDSAVIRQRLVAVPVPSPQRVVLVVDGSRRMKEYRETLKELIQSVPNGVEFGVILASDTVEELAGIQVASPDTLTATAVKLQGASFVGGCDNTRALERAWDWAAGAKSGAIVWLHATQPVEFGGIEGLRQRWERRPANPLLLSLQFGGGPDVVLQKLDGLGAVRQISRGAGYAEDIRHQFALWAGKSGWSFERRRERSELSLPGRELSSHVVRLWAKDEIIRLAASRADNDQSQAVSLASTYQLVTPVSGAVVLETTQQYQAAGLAPVSSSSVPTVPEPETWVLMGIGLVVLLVAARFQRKTDSPSV